MATQYSFAGGRGAGDPVLRSAQVKRSAPTPGVPAGQDPAPTGDLPMPSPMLGSGTPHVLPLSQPPVTQEAPAVQPAAPTSNLMPVDRPAPVLQQAPGNTSPIDPANSLRDQQINFDVPSGPVSFGGMNVDPGQRLNFDINPGSVSDAANKAFLSQLPALDQDFALQARDLSRQTSALGRTGSGLFNRGTNELSDRGRATRESLLGNLSYGAATTDAGNRLQADIARGGLQNAQEGRFLQASQANAGNALQGNMFNAGRADQLGLEKLGLQERQQGRQDRLASEANNNILAQLALFGQGFQGSPASTDLGASAALGQNADLFGSNAAQQSQASGDFLSQLAAGPLGQYAVSLLGGAKKAPAATPDNYYQAD